MELLQKSKGLLRSHTKKSVDNPPPLLPLPPEIQITIVEAIPKVTNCNFCILSALYTFALVSRACNHAATRSLYENIDTTRKHGIVKKPYSSDRAPKKQHSVRQLKHLLASTFSLPTRPRESVPPQIIYHRFDQGCLTHLKVEHNYITVGERTALTSLVRTLTINRTLAKKVRTLNLRRFEEEEFRGLLTELISVCSNLESLKGYKCYLAEGYVEFQQALANHDSWKYFYFDNSSCSRKSDHIVSVYEFRSMSMKWCHLRVLHLKSFGKFLPQDDPGVLKPLFTNMPMLEDISMNKCNHSNLLRALPPNQLKRLNIEWDSISDEGGGINEVLHYLSRTHPDDQHGQKLEWLGILDKFVAPDVEFLHKLQKLAPRLSVLSTTLDPFRIMEKEYNRQSELEDTIIATLLSGTSCLQTLFLHVPHMPNTTRSIHLRVERTSTFRTRKGESIDPDEEKDGIVVLESEDSEDSHYLVKCACRRSGWRREKLSEGDFLKGDF